MTRDVVLTVPVEMTLHLPDYRDDGGGSLAMFLLQGGGSWIDEADGTKRGFGIAGVSLAAYLPDRAAVTIGADKMVDAALVWQRTGTTPLHRHAGHVLSIGHPNDDRRTTVLWCDTCDERVLAETGPEPCTGDHLTKTREPL